MSSPVVIAHHVIAPPLKFFRKTGGCRPCNFVLLTGYPFPTVFLRIKRYLDLIVISCWLSLYFLLQVIRKNTKQFRTQIALLYLHCRNINGSIHFFKCFCIFFWNNKIHLQGYSFRFGRCIGPALIFLFGGCNA